MKGVYPSRRYHPELGNRLVHSAEEEALLGEDWFCSPAEFGVETEPGRVPDPVIAAKKIAFEKMRAERSAKGRALEAASIPDEALKPRPIPIKRTIRRSNP